MGENFGVLALALSTTAHQITRKITLTPELSGHE